MVAKITKGHTYAKEGEVNAVNLNAHVDDATISELAGSNLASTVRLISIGTSAPASPSANDVWFDTTDHFLKRYDGANWVSCYAHIGASAPSDPQEGDLWYDSTNNKLKSYDGSAWNISGIPSDSTIGLVNLVKNGAMGKWSAGVSKAPDDWTLIGTGATIARDDSVFKYGSYSAKPNTNGTSYAYLTQSIFDVGLKGKKLTASCWINTAVSDRVKICLYDTDGVNVETEVSSFHTGGGWELLTVTKTIQSDAVEILIRLQLMTGSAITVYFDATSVYIGEGKFAFSKHPEDFFDFSTAQDSEVASDTVTETDWHDIIGSSVIILLNITNDVTCLGFATVANNTANVYNCLRVVYTTNGTATQVGQDSYWYANIAGGYFPMTVGGIARTLPPGTYTFKLQAKVSGGTGTYKKCNILASVQPHRIPD